MIGEGRGCAKKGEKKEIGTDVCVPLLEWRKCWSERQILLTNFLDDRPNEHFESSK